MPGVREDTTVFRLFRNLVFEFDTFPDACMAAAFSRQA